MTKPDKPVLQPARASVSEWLPRAVQKAARAYSLFANRPPPEDSREFLEFQRACQAALAHLEALQKLADAVAEASKNAAPGNAPDKTQEKALAKLEDLLATAREAVTRLPVEAGQCPEHEGTNRRGDGENAG